MVRASGCCFVLRPSRMAPSAIAPSSTVQPSIIQSVDVDAHEVAPQLWIGSDAAAFELCHSGVGGFTHVLSLVHPRRRQVFKYPDVVVGMILPVTDDSKSCLLEVLPTAFDFINTAVLDANSKVLIHCGDGLSCSPSVLAAYLVAKKGMTRDAALEMIALARGLTPSVNTGFKRQLLLLEEDKGDVEEAKRRWISLNRRDTTLTRGESMHVDKDAKEVHAIKSEGHALFHTLVMLHRVTLAEKDESSVPKGYLGAPGVDPKTAQKKVEESHLAEKLGAVALITARLNSRLAQLAQLESAASPDSDVCVSAKAARAAIERALGVSDELKTLLSDKKVEA